MAALERRILSPTTSAAFVQANGWRWLFQLDFMRDALRRGRGWCRQRFSIANNEFSFTAFLAVHFYTSGDIAIKLLKNVRSRRSAAVVTEKEHGADLDPRNLTLQVASTEIQICSVWRAQSNDFLG